MAAEHLEFLMEIDAKMDGLEKATAALGDAEKALHRADAAARDAGSRFHAAGAASAHASEAHGRHGHAVWQLGHQYEYVKNGIHEFAEAIGLVLAFEAIEKLTEKVIELGEEVIHAAAKAERAELSFKLLLGAEGADELLGYLSKIAEHTEFVDERLQGAAGSLLRVGFAGQGLKRALAASLDIAALPGGDLEGALSSLERLKRTGRVDNRTLGGIGFGEKDFLAQLSARTGKASSVLKKEMEKGKLDVNQALESLYDLIHKRTGKALGAAGVAMSETLGARITKLKDAPDELFKTLARGEAFERFSAKVGQLVKLLNPEGALGGKLAKGLEALATKAADLFEQVDFEKTGNYLIDFLDKLPGRLETAGEVLSAFGTVIKDVWWFVDGVGTSLGELAAKIYLAGEWIAGVYNTVVGYTAKLFEAASNIGTAIWQGLTDGLMSGLTHVTDAVGSLGDSIVGKLKGLLGIHSPSTVFADMGKMSGEGYLQGLDASMGKMTDSVPVGAFAKPALGGGSGGGPIQVTVNITTNLGGGGSGPGGEATGEQIGEQVAKHVESILPSALVSAFERMQQEAGS